MRKVRDAKDAAQHATASPGSAPHSAEILKRLIVEMGRLRPLRDPFSSLAADLTPPQMHAILWLGNEGPLSSSVLAQRVGCGQPTVTGVVDRLEKLGLVERERDSGDRRVVRVRLTDAGLAAHAQMDALFTEKLEHMLEAMTVEDRGHVLRILEDVVEHFRIHPDPSLSSSSTPSTSSPPAPGSDPEDP